MLPIGSAAGGAGTLRLLSSMAERPDVARLTEVRILQQVPVLMLRSVCAGDAFHGRLRGDQQCSGSPTAETAASEAVQCRFKSRPEHQSRQWGISDNGSTLVLHFSSGGSTPPFSTSSTAITVSGPDGTAGVLHASIEEVRFLRDYHHTLYPHSCISMAERAADNR